MAHPFVDVETVKRVVVEAGDYARSFVGDLECGLKDDQSLVTVVDRGVELRLEQALKAAYPGFAFLGEEYGLRGPESSPMWACDPIDGTTNFVLGMPHWCVSVGLLVDDVPELGVIYLPRLGELFWATRGGGAFCNGARLACVDRADLLQEDAVCLTSNSLKTLNTDALPSRLRCLGSIAAEMAYTARGNLLATVGLAEGIVDMAAALCIGAEAGCEFRYLAGPAVDIRDLIERRRTVEHFVFALPGMRAYLARTLRPRPAVIALD